MILTTKEVKGVVVVYVAGAIFFGQESEPLRILIKRLLCTASRIVLDLEKVSHIDSGGVGNLVAVYVSARNLGGNIKLANVTDHTREVLRTTNLDTVFEIFDKTEDAIES